MAALWSDLAEYVGPTPNMGGRMSEYRGQVTHIMAGSYDGSIAWGKNPQSSVSFHFAVRRDGHIAQLVPVDRVAWTQRDGNGHWISVENEGVLPQALTDAQVEANARLFARGHLELGWPLQLATSPLGQGLGHHSMGAENGIDWGHSACPGEAIKAQKPTILARAIAIVNGDDVSKADVRQAILELMAEGADRNTKDGRNFANRWYALTQGGVPDVTAKLDAILAAALNDGDTTVTMDPAVVAQLQQGIADLRAWVKADLVAAARAFADALNAG